MTAIHKPQPLTQELLSSSLKISSTPCVHCYPIFASKYLHDIWFKLERLNQWLSLLGKTFKRRRGKIHSHRNLSINFPAHRVASATFTENTDILLFSLRNNQFYVMSDR